MPSARHRFKSVKSIIDASVIMPDLGPVILDDLVIDCSLAEDSPLVSVRDLL
jgi:hypothetical protein